MASLLTTRQARLAELEAQTATMLAADSTATTEQIEAHTLAVQSARRDVAAAQALVNEQLAAPAAAVIQTNSTGPLSANPQVERDPKGGYRNLADLALEIRTVCRHEAQPSERLSALYGNRAAGGLVQGPGGVFTAAAADPHRETNSSEGWPIPPEFRTDIWTLVLDGNDLLSLLTMEPTISNAVWMYRDESTPWGGTGVQAYWRTESKKMRESKLETKPEVMELNELYAFVSATDELLQDYPRLNSRLTVGSARAIEWVSSDAIMWGDGVGKPRGWVNSPAVVSVAKETSQAAGTIYLKNLAKMYSRLYRGSGARPLFICNSDILPSLIELTLGTVPVWIPSNAGIHEAPDGSILGVATKFTEHAQTLGTKGDIQLVDLSGYYGIKRTDGVIFATSIHFWFDTGEQAFRWTFRMGGQPFMSKPITPAHGSNTKSHFVLLDTRA